MVKVDRVLIVATSRERLGDTAIKTGVWCAASHRPCRSDPRIAQPAALCNSGPRDSAACGTGQRNWRRRIMYSKTTATWWTLRLSRGAQSPWTLSPYVGSTAGTALSVSSERMVRCWQEFAHNLLLSTYGQVTPAESAFCPGAQLMRMRCCRIRSLSLSSTLRAMTPSSSQVRNPSSQHPRHPTYKPVACTCLFVLLRLVRLWKALSPHVVIMLFVRGLSGWLGRCAPAL